MFYKKKGIPEEGELAVCTVKKILPHSVFVSIDEYENKEGMVHISEVSPGRIRNIRDFVREGKVIVCKVLRLHKERGHIDLSLRRVSLQQRKKKEEEYKQEQKAEKLISGLLKEFKMDIGDFYKEAGNQILEVYGSLNDFFNEVLVEGDKALSEIKAEKKLLSALGKKIKEKIKLPEVVIEAKLKLSSREGDGIDRIKRSFEKTLSFAKQKKYKIQVSYVSAPNYRLKVVSDNYRNAEKALQDVMESLVKFSKDNGVNAEWEKRS
ncbi:MAG: S1 RNA-binding domain-containing protein [Candidatus Woesearchaeota archaeon]